MAVCRMVFVILERDAAFNQTAPRNVSRLLFHHHPHHVPNPNPVSRNYDMLSISVRLLGGVGVGRDLKIRQTYVQIVNFPIEVHTETPSKETRLIFVYSGLCARNIIRNIPSFKLHGFNRFLVSTMKFSGSTIKVPAPTPHPLVAVEVSFPQ